VDPNQLRLLSEISQKLDYAIRTVENPPVTPGGNGAGGTLGADSLKAVAGLLAPQSHEALCQRVMDLAIQVTGGERGFLMLIEEGRKLRFKVGHKMDQRTIQSEGEYSRTIIKQVVQTGEPVLIADGTERSASSSSLQGLRMRSLLCVPLLFGVHDPGGGSVGGILYLDARSLIKSFTREDQSGLQAVADAAARALENAAQLDKMRRFDPNAAKVQENFARLLDVGRTISSTLVLDDLLELVIEKVLEVTRADRGFLMLVEEGASEPQFKIGLTWNKKDGQARRKRKLDKTQFMFSTTVTNRALNERKSVVLKDVGMGGGDDPSVSMMQMDLHAVMCTPLIEKGKVLGLIYVDSKMSNQEFGDSDLELFEALAGQAAIGLKNALLYTQVAQQQRIESEIAIAATMQNDLCPETVPQIQGIELTGYMSPAREVGGDYYDYVEDLHAPGQVLGMVVGDVSGKGLGAGIVAVMARCFLRSFMSAYGLEDPSQLLKYLNHTLTGELKPGKFMTMLLMMWDARRSVVRYASAGHENLIVWRPSTRRAEPITSGGSPLGISRTTGGPTDNFELALQPGDTVVTYTDGVTEAMNMNDDEYTLERLVALVNHFGGRTPAEIQNAILADLAKHTGEREQSDDITMVILRRV
jgi:serine phosphatase RsbU (regulator of sigma subunit)